MPGLESGPCRFLWGGALWEEAVNLGRQYSHQEQSPEHHRTSGVVMGRADPSCVDSAAHTDIRLARPAFVGIRILIQGGEPPCDRHVTLSTRNSFTGRDLRTDRLMRELQTVCELAESKDDTYQVVKPCCGNKLQLQDKPQRRRRFFWWLRGGSGKPKKVKDMEVLERDPEWTRNWKKDWYKPVQMLTYPQVGDLHCLKVHSISYSDGL